MILFVCLEIMKHIGQGASDPWGLDKALVYAFFAGAGFLIAIVIIGVVGLLLEQALMLLARRFSWEK